MNKFFALEFIYPVWLLLLPLAWWLIWFYLKKVRQTSSWDEVCDPHLLQQLTRNTIATGKNRLLSWVITAIVTLGIIAAAGPSWRAQSHPLLEPVAARVVVLDLSSSMLAKDVAPNRLQRAVTNAKSLMLDGFEGQTALVGFAGAAFVISPLTSDAKSLSSFLDALNPSIMPIDGSRLDLALTVAQMLLSKSIAKTGDIVVYSDGVQRISETIRVADKVREQGNRLHVIAVGTREGAPIETENGKLARDQQGSLIIHKARLSELQQIANTVSGNFVKLVDSDNNIPLISFDGSKGEYLPSVWPRQQGLQTRGNDGVWIMWFLLPLALLLFQKNTLWLYLVFLVVPFHENAHAFDWDLLWKNQEQRAFEVYQQGDYSQVIRLSNDTQLLGAANFKSENYQQAIIYFQKEKTAASLYNLGNALAYEQRFLDAVIAYTQALSLDPEFTEAHHNKLLIEQYLASGHGDPNSTAGNGEDADETSQSSRQIGFSQSEQQGSGQLRNYRLDGRGVGSGAGAQANLQTIEEAELYTEESSANEQFLVQERENQAGDHQAIHQWLDQLAGDPSELFRRIFHRDYRQRTERRRGL